ncbi:MAG: ATP-dependent DNA helicase RecQ [Holophagales bacterium]|nr:ATP-dependent DNA helicase RecQ [Holophagales bacterium]
MEATALDLKQRLRSVFGHSVFRPHQEEVCRRTAAGADGLVVMPTGAGKSLCYQLPGLLRGGPTLVFSPLIALMEDQTAKLRELGLRAERIHSGRPRSESRQACRLYRDGGLDFLFIAPERLGVPGFIEFLERCRPALIAVDEAHCISQWGHDFRPDYRLLGRRLPRLRPAPVLALTATATPRIQDDIAAQLDLEGDQRYIYGFRRENLAVEVIQKRPSARAAIVAEVLGEEGRRPAIVYAPTRKETESLATRLNEEFPCGAYHAGLPAAERDRVQGAFLEGELEAIVATTAFGMGIDKPDIRTVVHTAMPASVEGYYQEIGRAGRDGAQARALLLYSWADRRTQEFLHGLSYPEIGVLKELHGVLSEEPREQADVQRRLRFSEDLFEAALDQLRIHGGAVIGGGYRVRRGVDSWHRTYRVQRRHRLDQIDEMTRFADHRGCRMLRLVRHFGDLADSGRRCGVCDVCAPEACLVRRFRAPLAEEVQAMGTVVSLLRRRDGLGTGRLFRDFRAVHGSYDRGAFEDLLGALAQSRILFVEEDSFQKDGETIRYQRAGLTPGGRRRGVDLAEQVLLPDDPPDEPPARRRRGGAVAPIEFAESDADPALVEALREWRGKVAREKRLPAYTVLHNRTMVAVAAVRPADRNQLLAIPGVGPTTVKRYGSALLRIVAAAVQPDSR